MTANPIVKGFWDRPTGSWQYVFHDPDTMKGAVVDPVWDYDPQAGATTLGNAEKILDYVKAEGIDVEWVLDTHPHADHFSSAVWLAEKLGAKRGIGERVRKVQSLWAEIYNTPELPQDGRQWDHLFAEGETFRIGNLDVKVMLSTGHTLASITYVVGDAAFVHDTLMQPESGTSRADFPGGSAAELWDSIRAILDLPAETRLFIGHDYPGEGKEPQTGATVADHRKHNKHVKEGISREEYIKTREERDATLPLPKLMLAALQVNIRGGRKPEAEGDGRSYLKIPLDYFEPR
ncbi:MBL fold metallo-hydrolase [Thioclava nitratireducens]|uniref:MBL fold metallo-hydrolase n=1 Tax=Thioclava nitratireducens TaxID=1915078 RepID=UPI0024819785|nr:MBL fold metallo-hydrolase [Thioclava nitratireducens]WGT52180.1 MBL fold metallo-hydrolase [Thioclava nitratireducens]